MGTWTITTTAAEDDAIAYAYQQSQKPILGSSVPPPAETEAAFFQRMTQQGTIAPMVTRHQEAKNQELVSSLATVPPENRPAVKADIEASIIANGGTVPLSTVTYLWSANTAPPPRNQSVEIDTTEPNFATLTKLTFHYLDAGNVDRMASLMALPVNTLVRLEDAANPANFVQAVMTGAPIQRQGANGYAELPARFSTHGGSFAALDTKPLKCSFS